MLNKPLAYEFTFTAIEMFSQIAVFNLQAYDYVHCEEEEGANSNVSLHIYTMVIFLIYKFAFFNFFFQFQKNPQILLCILIEQKDALEYLYIY